MNLKMKDHEFLAVLNLLHVEHGLFHDVSVLQVECLSELPDALDTFRNVLLMMIDFLIVLLIEILCILARTRDRS